MRGMVGLSQEGFPARGEDGEGDAFPLGGGAGTGSDLEVTVL